GQTGAGKTTCVMGLIIQWAQHSPEKIGWLVIDRHGEYGVTTPNGFIDILSKALKLNKKLNTLVRVYSFTTRTDDLGTNNLSDNTIMVKGNIDISSISLYDIGNALDLPPDKISDLEEAVDILANIIKTIDKNKIPDEWKNVFVDKETDQPTGQLLALLPLLVDNAFRYDGIGEKEKKGIYRVLLNAGIDIRKLRTYRRLILSILGLSKRNIAVRTAQGEKIVVVIDDSKSVFKVSPILKDPLALVKLMNEMIFAAQTQYNVKYVGEYPWRAIREEPRIDHLLEGNIKIDNIAEKVNRGEVVVLDVSKIPIGQGDVVIMSIVRRLFESRMGLGVDMIKQLPPIAIVSEEAPLYLSPDKVRSPYNVFARIAREGRKFGLGLVAITQLATQIERQILANFNTIISLRTKYVSDINYFSNIGVPGEALTGLGDREGYLYTPDLRVKEPIPVYFPGYFEYAETINNHLKEMEKKKEKVERKAIDEIFDDEGDEEI
ncbi:MAG: ATP-binding protein, partial [Staphylothermus sp.]|nr:ATP-binding protein [Staphylothermus sp.]